MYADLTKSKFICLFTVTRKALFIKYDILYHVVSRGNGCIFVVDGTNEFIVDFPYDILYGGVILTKTEYKAKYENYDVIDNITVMDLYQMVTEEYLDSKVCEDNVFDILFLFKNRCLDLDKVKDYIFSNYLENSVRIYESFVYAFDSITDKY